MVRDVWVHHVSKSYGQKKALSDVNLTIQSGEITILLGKNGAGKSTLMQAIAGLINFTGEIEVCGMKHTEVEVKKKLAYVPEIPHIYDFLTIKQHLEFIARAYRLESYQPHIDSLVERFELEEQLNKIGKNLSKGMKQKLNLCMALLIQPQVIIFDEPMLGLDIAAINQLKKIILELRESGCAVLISTHMLDWIADFWNKVYILHEGIVKNEIKKSDGHFKNISDLEALFFKITI